MKKTVILLISAILFPLLFIYLQFNFHVFYLKLHDSYTSPKHCQVELSSLYGPDALCACPAINIVPQGFPVLWTGYGQCGLNENDEAKKIDLTLGATVELVLIGVFIVIKRKHHKTVR